MAGWRRAWTVGILTVVITSAWTGPALAHGRGSDATNYDSRITAGAQNGDVRWQVYGGDEYLAVTNSGDRELLVLGYSDEPYLRIGPDGVFENRNTPTAYLNEDRYAQVTPPDGVDAEAEPSWLQVSDGSSWYWHDHRIHWMSPAPPPAVRERPAERQLVQEWTVGYQLDGQASQLTGELVWVPGPSPWPWLVIGLVLSLPALAGLRTREQQGGWPGLARPAAVTLGVIAALNLIHLVDDLAAVPQPPATVALAAVQTALFIGIAAFGAVRGWQAGDGAFTALGVGSGSLVVGQGLLYVASLSASQIASVFPDVLGRVVVGASIAQALTVGAVAVIGTRRLLPPAEPLETSAEPSSA